MKQKIVAGHRPVSSLDYLRTWPLSLRQLSLSRISHLVFLLDFARSYKATASVKVPSAPTRPYNRLISSSSCRSQVTCPASSFELQKVASSWDRTGLIGRKLLLS